MHSNDSRGVTPTVEAGANYVLHLLAAARPETAGEYGAKHAGSLDSFGRVTLRRYDHQLRFGDGRQGVLPLSSFNCPHTSISTRWRNWTNTSLF